ncbi:hypothetical protein PsYK624_074400 [Phanerochaete sordida]|uniref:Uncharacterized protein n=1 Tax=Phanerochaete sordida TaxID=48140 RepID=A0A9P3GAN0_9APHY|nr:hypothetical protein PsYK624_074400 [Phanerochaete sordida]
MAFISLVTWLPLLLVITCVLEESLELSSFRRSHVLYHLTSLLLELASCVLRVPIRCLAFVGLCKRVHVHEFATLAQRVTLRLGLWTEEDQAREVTIASLEDELARERRRIAYQCRLQTQFAQAQTEIRHLRAENLFFNSRLQTYEEELTTYHAALQQKCQEWDQAEQHANEEKILVSERLVEMQSQNAELQSDMERAAARIRILNARLHDEKDVNDRDIQLLEHALKLSQDQCRLVKLGAQRLEQKRTSTIYNLVYVLSLLHGFAFQVRGRLGPALRAKDSLMARWKVLSAQKIDARRTLVRHLHYNTDLQSEIRQLSARASDVEKEALRYRTLYNDSIKARDIAARKFRRFHDVVTTRYTDNITKLLAGLLVLWRHNLILTERLVLAQENARAQALAPPLRRHRLIEFVHAEVQCTPTAPELADAETQCSPDSGPEASFSDAGVQCFSEPHTPKEPVTCDIDQGPTLEFGATVTDASTGPTVSMFCAPNEASARTARSPSPSPSDPPSPLAMPPVLRLPAVDTATDAPRTLDRSELSARVQRLLEKFEALSVVHQTYRDFLLVKTRDTAPDAAGKAEAFQERAPLLLEQRRSLAASMHAC